MSEPIKAGDLVVVVKPCRNCGAVENLGYIFRVKELFTCEGELDCCGVEDPTLCAIDPSDDMGIALCELKRIPPLDELEGQRSQEDIREPA